MNLIYWFIIGCCIGSFVNVLVWRLPRHMNFVYGRSRCPHCGHDLTWYDLIPILGWLMVKGRCRYCHHAISPRYPIVEWILGCLALICGVYFEYTAEGLLVLICISILTAIALLDQDTMRIENRMLLALCIALLPLILFFSKVTLPQRLIGACAVSIPMSVINHAGRECFGGGDIKLMAICGYWLGASAIVLAFLLAVLLGGEWAISLLWRGLAQRSSYIPFGPFLIIGVMISLFCGESLILWYTSLLAL